MTRDIVYVVRVVRTNTYDGQATTYYGPFTSLESAEHYAERADNERGAGIACAYVERVLPRAAL